MKKRTKVFLILLAVFLVLCGLAIGLYANNYHPAVKVEKYMASSNGVTVKPIAEGYFFDGPGDDKALLFCPGALVEETAYAPILKSLAEKGVDCFLIKMPLKLAFFGMQKAEAIRAQYAYESYYLAGHSLGGAMAANYAADHARTYKGLFLLAAYPTKDMSHARIHIVSIYGENDDVLNYDKLMQGFRLVPRSCEKIKIAGGNHAGFGSYGAQKGDGTATITREEQWNITVKTILENL